MTISKKITFLLLGVSIFVSPTIAQEVAVEERQETFILNQQCINTNGEIMEEGATTILFSSDQDGCEQQERTCTAGVLDGDPKFQYYQCVTTIESENNCTRNNQIIPEYSTITAYKDSVVTRDMSCSFVEKICIGGELQGPADFSETSCQFENRFSDAHKEESPEDYDKFGNIKPEVLLIPPVNNGNSCATSWGESVPSGATIVSFDQQYGGLQGVREYKISLCTDGAFDNQIGNYQSAIHKNPKQSEDESNNATTQQLNKCRENNKGMIGIIEEYKKELLACNPEFDTNTITSLDGFTELDDEPCEWDGQEIPNGESVTAYSEGTFRNGIYVCPEETRTCNNGELSGTYTETKCSNPRGNGPHRCVTPIGPLEHGKSITLYKDSTVQHPAECESISRECNFGDLEGDDDYDQTNCKQVGDFCAIPNGTVNHGEYTISYTKESVPYGVNCEDFKETIQCIDGELQGRFDFPSCYSQEPQPCVTPDGVEISHGQVVTRYQKQQVAGQASDGEDICPRQARTCNNGKRVDSSGQVSPFTYANVTCNVIPPAGNNISN